MFYSEKMRSGLLLHLFLIIKHIDIFFSIVSVLFVGKRLKHRGIYGCVNNIIDE